MLAQAHSSTRKPLLRLRALQQQSHLNSVLPLLGSNTHDFSKSTTWKQQQQQQSTEKKGGGGQSTEGTQFWAAGPVKCACEVLRPRLCGAHTG